MTFNERQIIKECLNNNREAQNLLYKTFAPKMYVVCLRYAGNKNDANDILQEAFIRVFKYLGTFKYKGSLEGWIRKIVVRTALNFLKYKYEYADYEDNIDDTQDLMEESITNLNIEEIIKIIQELPEGKRIIFNLYVFEGYSHKEIAEMLDISVKTSKAQYCKAKNYIIEKLNSLKIINYENK
ncbi:MAG: RNA polymerase sigma factor [Bacteroidales bacterium]|nr:RNA polymerase sigma factor [Bacteroidales bacterium]